MKKLILLLSLFVLFTLNDAKGGIINVTVNNITENSAVVSWITDMPVTTELRLGVMQAGGTYVYTTLPALAIPDATFHSYPLNNLQPLTNYRVEALSFDNNMDCYIPCDDGSNPASFTTLGSAGPVVDIDLFTQYYSIPVNGWTMIWGNAKTLTGTAFDKDVIFTISNGAPGGSARGAFEPATAVTDNNGDFFVMFYGLHYGKAKIEVMIDDVISELEIMILPDNQKNRSKNK